jgi:hypothetical protein
MYNCDACGATSKPGKPRRTWPIRRKGQIVREPAVCARCQAALKDGVPFEELAVKHQKPVEVEPVPTGVVEPNINRPVI